MKFKYRNRPTTVEGIRFASKKEAKRYSELVIMEKCGVIRSLVRQVAYPLTVNGQLICKYIADFVYREGDETIVEDAKGFRTPEYKIKAKLMKAVFGITIKEV